MKKRSIITTYYEPVNCQACEIKSNAGSVIAVKLPEKKDNFLQAGNNSNYAFICPSCYKRLLARLALDKAIENIKAPTCLKDPDRRAELLERYKY